ncbi:MAG TPA: hypothetical protein VHJ69_10665 [Gemmatimonadales bacterium]|nr:hypothetical protein [Gemmatimonadales bacterium]
MATAVEPRGDIDRTDIPHIVRTSFQLGLAECVVVFLMSLASRFLSGPVETIALALLLILGLALVSGLPGLWTRARTIEGIAGAAGIGLGAAAVFLLVDVAVLQPIGTYTNRWRELGGGSNWWYHPVWWMVGTYLPWMGAWFLAHQAAKGESPSIAKLMLSSLIFAVLLGGAAVLVHFPGASWTVATFGVAFLPGIAAAVIFSGLGLRRR